MKTIPIQIRVRTDELGNWAAYGWGGPNGNGADMADGVILDMMDPCDGKQERWTTVLADVPLPAKEESEVKGRVQ